MSRSSIIGIVIGFFLLTFLVYGVSLGNRFVAWDDNYVISFNPVVHGLTWEHITKSFTTFVDPELYNPLTFISYQIDFMFGGLKPFVYHLDNLIQHTINALLVVWFLFLLSKKKWIALTCGVLFAIHPLNVESVAWASARKDTLSTLFFLLTLIGYLYYRGGSRRAYVLSLIAFLCGLLSKVMVLTVPFVLILIDYLEHRPFTKKAILEKIPYFLLPIPFGIIAILGKKHAVSSVSISDQILAAIKSTGFYIEKLFVPVHLSVLYPYTKELSILSPDFFLPAIIVLILLGAAWYFRNRMREITFGILFYLLTVFPTFLNLIKGGTVYFASDRYAYIPQIGILFLCASVVYAFCKRTRHRHIASAAVACITLIFSVLAYRQSLTWRDTQTLFQQTLKYYPDAVAARINLGFVYSASGMHEQAMQQFTAGLQTDPDNALLVTNIAGVYEKQGRIEEAIAEYKKAMEMEPTLSDAVFGLGIVYERQGKLDEALALYRKVEEMNPGYVGVYNSIGSIYTQKNDLQSAKAAYEKALTIDPYYPDALYNLGYIAKKDGDLNKAIHYYTRTLESEGDKVTTLTALAEIYAEQNKAKETIDMLQRILNIEPANPFAKELLNALRANGY